MKAIQDDKAKEEAYVSTRTSPGEPRLWDDLLPFQQSLSEMRIFCVQYPHVVSRVVPLVSVVLGFNEARSISEARKQILQAAEKLSQKRE